jgi:hypothetical protein
MSAEHERDGFGLPLSIESALRGPFGDIAALAPDDLHDIPEFHVKKSWENIGLKRPL